MKIFVLVSRDYMVARVGLELDVFNLSAARIIYPSRGYV
jgi:hypothetical protein